MNSFQKQEKSFQKLKTLSQKMKTLTENLKTTRFQIYNRLQIDPIRSN